MACSRVKTLPNTSSHSAGWTARVTSSVRSCRSFCSSTRHIVATREIPVATVRNGPGSAEATGGAAGSTDIAHVSLLGRGEGVAGVAAEDVVERGRGADRALEVGRCAQRADPTAVHERDPVAVLVGLLHGVRRDEHGHAGGPPDLVDARP